MMSPNKSDLIKRGGFSLGYLCLHCPELLLDPEDLEKFKYCTASVTGLGYVRITYLGKQEYLHKLLLGNPKNQVDHIDGNRLNNKKCNLREATVSQNNANKQRQSNNTSGYKGVNWQASHNQWHARIQINGKTVHIGYYRTRELAALAYNKKALELFGDFAVLNKVEDVKDGRD